MRQRLSIAIALSTFFLLAGCARFQPRVADELPKRVPADWATPTAVETLPIASSLLDLMDDPALETVVEEALAGNPDLKATALRLQARQLRLSETRSRLWPRLSAGASKGRDNQTPDRLTGKRKESDTHRVGVTVSWEIDLWGRLADQSAAARADVKSGDMDYRAARDSLAARVIQAWLEQAANRRALAIETERIEVLETIEEVLIARYQDGIGTLDELSTARSRTQIARADLSDQQTRWRRSVRKLELLAGRMPRAELLVGDRLPKLAVANAKLPLTVLEKRPDVKSALARLAAARYLARSADKAMLPEVHLTGQLFRTGTRLTDISSATNTWSLLGSLVQPLFEGGRLRDESRARSAEAEAARMDLATVALRALKEVEDALDAEQELAVQIEAMQRAAEESAASSRYFVQRYRQGLDNLQSLLIAKEQEMRVRLRLNQLRADRLSTRVDLALAAGLGVGPAGAVANEVHNARIQGS